jgi:two-component system sensor histidine kinase KdpD
VEWVVACVETPSYSYNKQGKARVNEMMRFAEKLGAETVTLTGQNIADTLLTYARSANITRIITGKPGKPSLRDLLFGSTVNELARKCGEIDLFLMSGDAHDQTIKVHIQPPKHFPWVGMVLALIVTAAITVSGRFLSPYMEYQNMGLVYMLGVVSAAYAYGFRVSLATSLISVLAYDYFFVYPLYSFQISDIARDIVNFVVILGVSFLICLLTSRLKQQTLAMRQRENRTEALYHLTRDLAKSSNPYELLQIASYNMQKFFKCETVIYYADKGEKLKFYLDNSGGKAKGDNEAAVAQWAYTHNAIAGKDTETLPSARGVYVPLSGAEKTVGVMGLFSKEVKQFADPEQLHMLEMFASQAAVAVEGAQLAEVAIKSESDIENERFRNMLLSTFSLDISAPLKSISESSSQLLELEGTNGNPQKEALIKKIQSQVQRLNNLYGEITEILKSKETLG